MTSWSKDWNPEHKAAWEAAEARYLRQMAVYFMQHGAAGLVKIGWTTNLEKRRKTIQTYCPLPVTILGWRPGGHHEEVRLHHLFAKSLAWGEWYRPTADLIAFAATQCEHGPFVKPPAPRKEYKAYFGEMHSEERSEHYANQHHQRWLSKRQLVLFKTPAPGVQGTK